MSSGNPRNSLLEKAALVLAIALTALFLFYFIVYVNGPDTIFYSFGLFIVLTFVIVYNRRLMEYALFLSIALLFSSSITFFSLCDGYYVAGAIIAFVALLLMSKRFGIGRDRIFFATLALFLPILFSIALSNMGYMDNVIIISYYLIISVALAVFIGAFAASNGLEAGLKRVAKQMMAHKQAILTVFVLASVAILVSPIWPTGVGITFNALPYVPISLMGNSGAAGDYTLSFNASAYSNYESGNLSNIRFFSQSGGIIKATLLSNSSFTDTSVAVMLGLPSGTGALTLRFLPKNVSFDGNLTPVTPARRYALPLNASFGSITSGLNYARRIVQHTVYLERSIESNESVTSSPYYLAEPLCTPGNDTRASISVISNVTASLFIFNSSAGFYQALADSRRAPAAYPSTSPYVLYVDSFANRTDSRVLNGTSISFNFSFPKNVSCVQYVLAFNSTAKFRISTTTHYLTYIAREAWVYGPEAPTPQGPYLKYSFSGFLPESIGYVMGNWQKWWVDDSTLGSLLPANTLT